jgi:predicted nucleic acid-binding protein
MSTPSNSRGIIDTNTVILLERITDVSALPQEPMITSVTLAELSVGPLIAPNPHEQAIRQLRLQQVESDFHPLPFDAAAARSFGRISSSLRRGGRKVQARAFDAMIAATAISNNLPLFTCNPSDFDGIDDLDLRHIPHPDLPTK